MIRVALALVCLSACGDAVEMPGDGSIEAGDFICQSEDDVSRFVFAPTCATSRCHSAEAARGRLDLETPGITERLMGRTSVHRRCTEETLLVPGDPASSFMMRKVLGTHGNCGDPMPNRGEISPAQRRCIAAWIVNAAQ